MGTQRSFYLTMVKNFQMILWHMSVMNLTSNSISLVHTHQDLMAKQKILTNFLKPQFTNSVRKTVLHGTKCLTQSFSHTNVVLTLQLVKHHILCSISETHPYQFINRSSQRNHTRVMTPFQSILKKPE